MSRPMRGTMGEMQDEIDEVSVYSVFLSNSQYLGRAFGEEAVQ